MKTDFLHKTELSKDQKQLLLKRLEKYESEKMKFKSWAEVKGKLKKGKN